MISLIIFTAALLLGLASAGFAQDSSSAENAAPVLVFPTPTTSGVLGIQNAGAISEISAFLQAVMTSPWTDLQVSGILTFPAGDEHAATLYLSGADYSRLDIVMGSGTRSLRSHGASSGFQSEFGNQMTLLPATARTATVALPLLWVNSLNSPTVSFFDHGIVQVNGQSLHRITAEYALNTGSYQPGNSTIATDLYFDPVAHLLLYSVDTQFFANSANQSFLRVTSYSGYQPFSGFVIPSTIGQSLNGQSQWTLQLTQAVANSNLPLNTFSF